MTTSEIKAFWTGVVAAQDGKVLFAKNKAGVNTTSISSIDFNENYTGTITLSDGTKYYITKTVFLDDGKINYVLLKKDNVTKKIVCQYNADGELVYVGTVSISNINKLGLSDTDYPNFNNVKW